MKKGKGTILKSKPKVQKVGLQFESSDFECYDKSDGKPVHANADRKITGKSGEDSTLSLLPPRSEKTRSTIMVSWGLEVIIGIVARVFGDLRNFRLLERFGSVPYL